MLDNQSTDPRRSVVPLADNLRAYLDIRRGDEPIYKFAKRLGLSPQATRSVIDGKPIHHSTRKFIESRIEEMRAGFASVMADHPVIVHAELPDYFYDLTCVFCNRRFTGKIIGYYPPPITRAWSPTRCCDLDKKRVKKLYDSGFPDGACGRR